MNRRRFMIKTGTLICVLVAAPRLFASRPERGLSKMTKSQAEWKKILGEKRFHILRKEGTERAFSSPLNKEKRAGTYVCAGCELPLFTSDMKYDSGTGWPSFFNTIEGSVATQSDFRMIIPRTEYHCVRCEGHQGHVFNDGPEPTGKRWCNNGLALRFLPSEKGA